MAPADSAFHMALPRAQSIVKKLVYILNHKISGRYYIASKVL